MSVIPIPQVSSSPEGSLLGAILAALQGQPMDGTAGLTAAGPIQSFADLIAYLQASLAAQQQGALVPTIAGTGTGEAAEVAPASSPAPETEDTAGEPIAVMTPLAVLPWLTHESIAGLAAPDTASSSATYRLMPAHSQAASETEPIAVQVTAAGSAQLAPTPAPAQDALSKASVVEELDRIVRSAAPDGATGLGKPAPIMPELRVPETGAPETGTPVLLSPAQLVASKIAASLAAAEGKAQSMDAGEAQQTTVRSAPEAPDPSRVQAVLHTAETNDGPASVKSAAPHRVSESRPAENAPPTIETIGEYAVRSVRYLARNGERTFTVRLEPESLGELRFDVTSSGSSVTVRLVSANPAVRELLETQTQALRDALAREGFAVARISVTPDSGSYTGQHHAGRDAGQTDPSSDWYAARYYQSSGGNPGQETRPERASTHVGELNVLV